MQTGFKKFRFWERQYSLSQEKSQLRVGVILNYINIGLGNLIPIFYTPIMLQLLGQNEYGLYKLSSSVTSYMSLISLGIGSAVGRYLIKYRIEKSKEDEERILGLFMMIFQVIAFLALIIGTVLTFNLQVWYGDSLTAEELFRMRILVFIMVCNTALGFAVSPFSSVVSAHERFTFQQCMNILSTCVAPVLNLVVLWLGYASIGMAMVSLAMQVVTQFCYWAFVRKKLHIRARLKNMPFDELKGILKFSFWVFVANVVGQLYNATDTVMIGAIPDLATAGTAVYSVGSTFNTIVFSATTGVSNVLSPRTNKMVFEGADIPELTGFAVRIGRIQAYIISLIVTGFIAFGRPFIYFYAGAGYAEAYWVAVFMMVPNMIPLVQSVCLNIIVAQNRHQFRSIVYLAIAVANVFGTWILLHYMGVAGAALVTGVCLILGQGFVMNWYYWKKIHIDIPAFWKQVGKVYIIPVIMCIAALLLSHVLDFYNIWILAAGIVIYTIIFCFLSWKLSFDEYEKELIKGIGRSIMRKIKRK